MSFYLGTLLLGYDGCGWLWSAHVLLTHRVAPQNDFILLLGVPYKSEKGPF